jgi:adenylate cyclase
MNFELAIWRDGLHQQFSCPGPVVQIGEISEAGCVSWQFPNTKSPSDNQTCGERGQAAAQRPAIRLTCDSTGKTARIEHTLPSLHLVWTENTLERGAAATVALPALMRAGDALLELRLGGDLAGRGRKLQTISASGNQTRQSAPLVPPQLLGQAPAAETLASWFEALSRLQRTDALSQEFLECAAAAVCDPGGLNAGFILLRNDGELSIAASHFCDPQLGITFCRDLVQRAIESGQTLFHDASQTSKAIPQLEAVVAAPIFGADQDVVGVVYGRRSLHGSNQRCSVRALEALWVQLVADAVGAAMQRAEAESRAMRTRVLFEQAFSSELVTELLRDPELLAGQQREITLLFCDIHESTRISEQLGAPKTYQLLSEVLEFFTKRVMDHGGVIIDYYGDGLAAMWNAPHDQNDHALRACHAAVAMAAEINQLNERWYHLLKERLRIGVGIHTGVAHVGNAGTSRRLKYGPRGRMVTVASRLENATREVGVPILISANTDAHLHGQAVTRRICRAKLTGIREPVDLIELYGLDPSVATDSLSARLATYANALACLEAGDFERGEELFTLCETQYGDAPSRLLREHARRVVNLEILERKIIDLSGV